MCVARAACCRLNSFLSGRSHYPRLDDMWREALGNSRRPMALCVRVRVCALVCESLCVFACEKARTLSASVSTCVRVCVCDCVCVCVRVRRADTLLSDDRPASRSKRVYAHKNNNIKACYMLQLPAVAGCSALVTPYPARSTCPGHLLPKARAAPQPGCCCCCCCCCA